MNINLKDPFSYYTDEMLEDIDNVVGTTLDKLELIEKLVGENRVTSAIISSGARFESAIHYERKWREQQAKQGEE